MNGQSTYGYTRNTRNNKKTGREFQRCWLIFVLRSLLVVITGCWDVCGVNFFFSLKSVCAAFCDTQPVVIRVGVFFFCTYTLCVNGLWTHTHAHTYNNTCRRALNTIWMRRESIFARSTQIVMVRRLTRFTGQALHVKVNRRRYWSILKRADECEGVFLNNWHETTFINMWQLSYITLTFQDSLSWF